MRVQYFIGWCLTYVVFCSAAREIARRLQSTNWSDDGGTGGAQRTLLGRQPRRGPTSRRLLDHTVTHNIEMLKDVRVVLLLALRHNFAAPTAVANPKKLALFPSCVVANSISVVGIRETPGPRLD